MAAIYKSENQGFMNKFETIFLHIGLHKTGSSAIQEICDKNRGILAVHDTFYPAGRWHGQLGSVFSQNKLGFIYNIHSGNSDLSEIGNSDSLYIKTLSQELSETNCRRAVISYEGFIDLDFSEICSLRDFLYRYSNNLKVIAYCRHPLSFAPSEISQRARMGLPTAKDDLANAPIPTFCEYLEKFAAAFGKERLTIADFARNRLYQGDVRLDFLTRIGISQPEALGISLPNAKANEALSAEAVCIAEMLATRFTPPLSSHSFSLRFDSILSKIRGNPVLLSPAEKSVIMQAAEPHLRYLEDSFGVTLSPPPLTEAENGSGGFSEMAIESIADYLIQNQLVSQGYRWLLGREPETQDVVSRHLRATDGDWRRLRQNVMITGVQKGSNCGRGLR